MICRNILYTALSNLKCWKWPHYWRVFGVRLGIPLSAQISLYQKGLCCILWTKLPVQRVWPYDLSCSTECWEKVDTNTACIHHLKGADVNKWSKWRIPNYESRDYSFSYFPDAELFKFKSPVLMLPDISGPVSLKCIISAAITEVIKGQWPQTWLQWNSHIREYIEDEVKTSKH